MHKYDIFFRSRFAIIKEVDLYSNSWSNNAFMVGLTRTLVRLSSYIATAASHVSFTVYVESCQYAITDILIVADELQCRGV